MKQKGIFKKAVSITGSIFAGFLLIPSTSFAATFEGPILSNCNINGFNMNDPKDAEIQCIVSQVTTWSFGIIGSIIVLVIIIAGMRYILSAGNPTQVEGAKKTLVGAIIGLIIVIFSGFMIRLVISFF